MEYMFSDAHTFNGDLSRWDTSNITTMFGMLFGSHAFNGDLSSWDTRVSGSIYINSTNMTT